MDSLNEFKKYIEAQIKVVNAENSNIEKYFIPVDNAKNNILIFKLFFL